MSDDVSFVGFPDTRFEGHHAMVLIGARKTAAGKYFFLLHHELKTSNQIPLSPLRMSSLVVVHCTELVEGPTFH